MLERIREGSRGVVPMSILGLVILSFVFAGVGSYINSSVDVSAATVNGEEITKATVEQAYQNERGRMEAQFGDAFAALTSDASYLQQFRQGILDRLIGEKLLEQSAQNMGLRVSDAQIKQLIVNMPEFQVAGQFDNERYQSVLRQNRLQPSDFRERMRVDMTRKQVSEAVLGSEFALSTETENAHMLQQQTRDARYVAVPAASFEAQAVVTDEEVASDYQINIAQFDTEQKVSLDYVELTLNDLLPSVEVSEAEAQTFYQQNMQEYRTEEERRVSHILFELSDDATLAKQNADNILLKLQAGEDFAELAKSNSSDTFSAENGGDLDWFGRDAMDPAFEDAAYGLTAIGDISGLVESEFGYHIIKLTDVKEEMVTPFVEVQEQILTSVKTQKAEEEFYNLQLRIAEVAFEVPDNLDEVAAIANKSILKTPLFSRGQATQSVANPKVLAAAFSPELIDEGVNSEVIELTDDHIMVVRVAQFEPERTKTLEEVSEQIKQRLLIKASQDAAREWSQTILTSLQQGEDAAAKFAELGLEWKEQLAITRTDASVDRAINGEIFKLNEQDDKNTSVVDMTNGDISLVQLIKINQATAADSNQLASLQRRLNSSRAQDLYGNFIESLKAEADITIYQ
ncbi:MAG: peptidyl-prolyl cis-trans isomerase D [Paraglaciecola sp.]|jgi:peptidyl-prolyl cis-trans isomerase D